MIQALYLPHFTVFPFLTYLPVYSFVKLRQWLTVTLVWPNTLDYFLFIKNIKSILHANCLTITRTVVFHKNKFYFRNKFKKLFLLVLFLYFQISSFSFEKNLSMITKFIEKKSCHKHLSIKAMVRIVGKSKGMSRRNGWFPNLIQGFEWVRKIKKRRSYKNADQTEQMQIVEIKPNKCRSI